MPGGNGEAVALEVLLCFLLCFGYLGMCIADKGMTKPKTVDIFSHYLINNLRSRRAR